MSDLAPSHLIVDLDAYAHNLKFVRSRIPEETAILAVLKAGGYGHGAVPLARRALDAGVSIFGVATVAEGIAIRLSVPSARVLLLGQPKESDLEAAIENDLILMVSDLGFAEKAGDVARSAKKVAIVHCEVDTGMGRQGFNIDDAHERILDMTRLSNIDIEGIATHFPIADQPNDFFTDGQLRTFRQLLKRLEKEGIPYELAHAANSAGVLNAPSSAFDMVRPGLVTYGVWPTNTPLEPSPLKPVATWMSTVVLIKDLPGGASVGYGRTYRTPNPRKVAIVPVGYADGYPFHLSDKSDVLIRGRRCPVRGRISMDMMTVDITDVPDVKVGAKVTLIGSDGHESVTVEELAKQADTIPYEILTGIGARVERTYIP